MSYGNMSFKFSRNRCKSSSGRPRLPAKTVALTLISLLLVSVSVTLMPATVFAEPASSSAVLSELGFTNITLSETETFPPGIYNVTLFAEFAEYYNINTLSYYPIETTDYQTIFAGPEGSTEEPYGGYVVPPLSKTVVVDSEFGLSLLAPYRYFTEYELNPDFPEQHVHVYVNLDSPDMFLICFEDKFGGGDRDFNDMVFSFQQIFAPEIVNVTRSPEAPNDVQSVNVTAQVTKGTDDVESVILSYQLNSSAWTNVTMTLEGGGYVADIPAQPYNTHVNYKVYAFDVNGYYDVSMLYSYTVRLSNRSPTAVITSSPATVYTGEAVEFNASESYDPDGTIVSYFWDFGDGSNSSETTVSHSYEEDGEYTVTLRVVDNEGLMDNAVATQVVLNRPPVAAFTESESSVNVNEDVSFDASSSYDLDGTVVSYVWGFDDGTMDSGVTVTHGFADIGSYNVTLTVNDNDGATDTLTHTIGVTEVANSPPVASFTVSAETVNVDEAVSFDASESYDPDGSIVSYSWDFGDGNTATGITAQHAYSAAGDYTVTLTVTDDDGATDTDTATIGVTTPAANEGPVASFTASSQTVSKGESIHFDGSESYDPDGTIVDYSWDFGDGNTATGVEVDHAYEDDGNYTVTLTVTDDDAATDSETLTITVTKTVLNQSPVAIFSKSAETVNVDEVVSFDASESYDSDGSIVSYSWDFGDGNTATGVTPEHAYSAAGDYTVTLTVTDDDGASSSAVDEVTVKEKAGNITSLDVISWFVLILTALTALLLLLLFTRRKRKKEKPSKGS